MSCGRSCFFCQWSTSLNTADYVAPSCELVTHHLHVWCFFVPSFSISCSMREQITPILPAQVPPRPATMPKRLISTRSKCSFVFSHQQPSHPRPHFMSFKKCGQLAEGGTILFVKACQGQGGDDVMRQPLTAQPRKRTSIASCLKRLC
jgi:hypothetical protein